MEDTRKQELFPYFAYMYSKQLNPDKYGNVTSAEEWSKLIQDSTEDIEAITAAAENLSEEDWEKLDKQYTAETAEASAQFAAKGAKLKRLMKSKKKCKCGCEIIEHEKGGKIVSMCACGCNINKKEIGGIMTSLKNRIQKPTVVDRIGNKKQSLKKGGLVTKQSGGDVVKSNPTVEKCGGKVKNRIKKGQAGTKVSKVTPTSSDSIKKYNRLHPNSDGKGPKNNMGKELKTPLEILNTARKEWKGKKVDVMKSKCGGKAKKLVKKASKGIKVLPNNIVPKLPTVK